MSSCVAVFPPVSGVLLGDGITCRVLVCVVVELNVAMLTSVEVGVVATAVCVLENQCVCVFTTKNGLCANCHYVS